jgi:hypothetical protein
MLQAASGLAGMIGAAALLPSTVLAAGKRRSRKMHGPRGHQAVAKSLLANPAPPPPPAPIARGQKVAGDDSAGRQRGEGNRR